MITCGIVFFCMHLHENKSIAQIEKNDEKMNSELLVKIMLDSYPPLSNVYKICPGSSQRLFAFGFFPCFFLIFFMRF